MRALLLLTLASIGLSTACSDDVSYIVVTVDRRAAVHEVSKLEVTLSNAGSRRTDSLDMRGSPFPVTFSISAPGREGDLGIEVGGLDADGALQGYGVGTTTLDQPTAAVMLEGADFVVNATYANSQFLSNDFEAVGLQLAALDNSTWTTTFREDCDPCNVLARRFDATGTPVMTEGAGLSQFNVTTTQTKTGSIPAAAAAGMTTIVAWDFFDTVGTGQGVACRSYNAAGAATAGQLTLATEAADVVTASALANGNFIVTWQAPISSMQVIRSVVVKPDCMAVTPPRTVSASSGTFGARRSHAAGNGTTILYAWVVDGLVHMRYGAMNGDVSGVESIPIPAVAGLDMDHVRVVPWGAGFAAVVRWSATNDTNPGKIEVYRIPTSGAAPATTGTPILITDQSGSDFVSDKAFGASQRKDGALMVAWHACPGGAAGSCDVFGRILRPTGVPVGPEINLATTRGSDQTNPSIVAIDEDSFAAAWTDASAASPDTAGTAVRARIVTPPYDDARAVQGALCGTSAPSAPPCGKDLACGTGSDGVARCYTTCTAPANKCPAGGTCTMVDALTSACTF